MDDAGIETVTIPMSSTASVEVRFVLREAVAGCHVACIITPQSGVHVFSTADTDTQPEYFGRREAAEYMARVQLPLDNLNAGGYLISAGIGIPGTEVFDRQDAIAFTIDDRGGFGSMKEGEGRAGLLVFRIPWKYVSVPDQCS